MLNDDLVVRCGSKPHSSSERIGAREAEKLLGVSRSVLHKLAHDGRLKACLIDRRGSRRHRLFNRSDVMRLKAEGTALKSKPRLRHIRAAWVRMFGPIPFGFTVIARDGQDRNVDPRNLALAPLTSRMRATSHYKTRRRTKRGTKRFWTADQRRYIRQHFPNSSTKAIAKHLGVSVIAVRCQAIKMGVRKSLNFLSANAKSAREQPIGTERLDKFNDRILVKVSVDGPQYKRWRPKHHLAWEKANDRPIPEGFRVVFKDGNRHNFGGQNLELVTRDEISARAFSKFLSYPAPLREAIKLNKKLKREVARRRAGEPEKAKRRPAYRAGRKQVSWTREKDRRIFREYPNTPTAVLAASLGVSVLSLRCRARRLGVMLKPEAILQFATEKAARIKQRALGEGSNNA